MNAVAEKPVPSQPEAASSTLPAATPLARRRQIGSLLKPALGLIALLGVLVGANWWLTEGTYIESTDNAYVQGDIAVLSSRVEGTVRTIHVADNQRVHAGDPLISLDPADLTAVRDQARGSLAEAAAAAATGRRQIEQARTAIDTAAAMITQAQAEATRAAADAARSGALTGSGWTSRQANDLAIATSRKADAALVATQAQRRSAEEALTVAEAQLVQAEARQRTAGAALQLAENNLAYTVIRAPFEGIVGNRAAQLGARVSPGQQLIAIAPPPESLFIVANFKETQLRRMQPGQPVRLIPDINPDAAVDGHLDSVAPATGALFSLLPPENATGNFTKVVQRVPVKLVLNPEQARAATWLRAGLSVSAEVDTRGPAATRRGVIGSALARLGLR